jgi:hypothetical protein
MRGWVCCLQLLLALSSTRILGSRCRGTDAHILLSQVQDCPTPSARSLYLYPPGTQWLSYTSRCWVLFVISYNWEGYGGGMWGADALYVGPCHTALGQTLQKTLFLAAAILLSHAVVRMDRIESTTSDSSSTVV